MRLAVIREGKALLYLPDTRQAITPHGGIEPAWLEVFYNPSMTFNRDLSILASRAYLRGQITLIDAMAGTGVRGIRYSLTGQQRRQRAAHLVEERAGPALRPN